MVRLKGSTVLLVMVHLTNGLAESGENLEKMWKLANLARSCELPYICMGDWIVSAIGALVKKPVSVQFSCSAETDSWTVRSQAGKCGPGKNRIGWPRGSRT